MKLSYRSRLFVSFALIFALFTTGVIFFERTRERAFKTEALKERLDGYAQIIYADLLRHPGTDYRQTVDSLLQILPMGLRVSIIHHNGKVLFDNTITHYSILQNHASRPEIKQAALSGTGSDIRTSASNKHPYLYYALKAGSGYIRVALPYNIQVKTFLQSDNLFLYFIILFFAITLLFLNAASTRFGGSIKRLHDFAMRAGNEGDGTQGYAPVPSFPHDEVGEVGEQIAAQYRSLRESKERVEAERQKLLQHVHSSEEGICFFSPLRQVEFFNGLFVQYLNLLVDEADSNPEALLSNESMGALMQVLDEGKEPYWETRLHKQGKYFSLRLNRFDDSSFEIILNDITKQEQLRTLKQEMTGNIAHELRTPVTAVRGYLETILNQPLTEEQRQHFTQRAYRQTLALSELIQDIGLITKIEEAPNLFPVEEVDLPRLLTTLCEDLALLMQERRVTMSWRLPDDMAVKGNPQLLYSIFRNLADNTLRYAGEGVEIHVNLTGEDAGFYYLSYFDTGCGIADESSLPRLFERFYRLDEGRTRNAGGSGLGLSIVKNAVLFHKGTIVAKNRPTGGLEFLFSLHK